ncbi:MAG TPA: hypothetical protein DCR12_03390 [Lachnospiraceae bacterium]|nr:hypothetical protein [Lachnospiraceae bacterium]
MKEKKIGTIIYIRLVILIVISFAIAAVLGIGVQNYFQKRQSYTLLREYIEDFEEHWDFNADMKDYAYEWGWGEAEDFSITEFQDNALLDRTVKANEGEVSEINIVDENGIVTHSSNPEMVGVDFHSDSYLSGFLCLLDRDGYYAEDFYPNPFDSNANLKMVYNAITVKNYKGFIAFGYDREILQNQMESKLWKGVTGNRIGNTGFLMVCNNDKTIVGVTEAALSDVIKMGVPYNGQVALPAEESTITYDRTDFYGVESYVATVKKPDYYLIAAYPVSEANVLRGKYNTLFLIIFTIILTALFVLLFILLKNHVVREVSSIHKSLKRITAGNLDEKANVEGSLEFYELSGGVNDTVYRLKDMIREAKEQLAAEMENARRIQESAVPKVFPEDERFSIFASMDTAEAVGGDFYDFFMAGDNLVIVMADVSGKGMPAALYMMRAMTLIRTYAAQGLSVEEVVEKTNKKLCEDAVKDRFVTAWVGFLDLKTGVLSYVHAGHTLPILINSEVSFLRQKIDLVMGGFEMAKYRRQEIALSPGDSIYLYTDGVTEAHNPDEELYGENRLLTFIREHADDSKAHKGNEFCEDKCQMILSDVTAFEKDAPQFDDITMMWVRYEGIKTYDE